MRAADQANVELIVVNNRYQAKVAIKNAQLLVRQGLDLGIEFQTDESAAAAVAAQYLEAGVPLVAIDIPHPGATYFGANNYQAGLLAGRHLGRWAKTQWKGQAHELLLLELGRAGSVVRSRITGILAGFREALPEAADSCRAVSIDGDGRFKVAMERVRAHLRASKADHVLVGAANDASALGAVRAFQEAGRASSCAIVGQNAEPDARAELRQEQTPLIATVGYFPEKYGEGLIRLTLDLLGHRAVPPAVFVKHQIVTRENVNHLYPNDGLMAGSATF